MAERSREAQSREGRCFRGILVLFQRLLMSLREKPRRLAPQEMLKKVLRADEPDAPGIIPKKTVELAPEAAAEELRLGFSWKGQAELSGLCLLLKDNGHLINYISGNQKGTLGSLGVQSRDIPDTPDQEDRGAFSLRLRSVPPDVFALAIVLLAQEPEGTESAAAFLAVDHAQLRLATEVDNLEFWRFTQQYPKEEANSWVAAVFYRGPYGSWRLEPMSMKLLIAGLKVGRNSAAIAEAADSIGRQLRWMLKDRRWFCTCEERKLHLPCSDF